MKKFICPECGSTEFSRHVLLSPDPSSLKDVNPWSGVMQVFQCAKCNRDIPAHLAELWDDISEEEAKNQWKKFYRDTK